MALEFIPLITGLLLHARLVSQLGNRAQTACPSALVTHWAVAVLGWLRAGRKPRRQVTEHLTLYSCCVPEQVGAALETVKLYWGGGHVHLRR